MAKKILVTGPESSGKSKLSNGLASKLDAALVPEYARHYLLGLGRPYNEDDLIHIARAQLDMEREMTQKIDRGYIVVDTSAIVLKIWFLEKFGRSPDFLDAFISSAEYYRIFLCKPNLPWEEDPLRENPFDRDRLYDLYVKELHSYDLKYNVIDAPTGNRLEQALEFIGRP